MQNLPDENTKRFAAVLNKLPRGRAPRYSFRSASLRGRKSLFIASAPLRYATGSHSSPRQSRRGILADK